MDPAPRLFANQLILKKTARYRLTGRMKYLTLALVYHVLFATL